MNNLLHSRRTHQTRYIVRVTFVNHMQTEDNTGIPEDNIWAEEKTEYGIAIRGRRVDYTNSPVLIAMVHADSGGNLWVPRVGDFVTVEDPLDGFLPRVVGIAYGMARENVESDDDSELHPETWDLSAKYYARPIPPQLEQIGNNGILHTYNPIFITYHERYEDGDATIPEFGKWYDRFVLFDSSETYKNKKSFIDYNEDWILEALEADEKHWSDVVWNMVESWDNNYREKDEYFYLNPERYPYRPDPVFDTISDYHQLIEDDYVLENEDRGVTLFDDDEDDITDKYPMPLTLQEIEPELIHYTAYDEMINKPLADIREAAENFANAELPLEPKEEKQIRIGRNKFILSDVLGDGKQIFITLKTHKDQQFSIIFHEDDEGELSQIRIRGLYGESIFMESHGTDLDDAISRVIVKGVEGQIMEMYDDVENNENYIYLLSSEGEELDEEYNLTKASYSILSNKKVPEPFKRLANNQGILNVGRMSMSGIYDTEINYFSNHQHYHNEDANLVFSNNNLIGSMGEITETKRYNLGSHEAVHTINRSISGGGTINETSTVNMGNATKTQIVEVPGSNVSYSYNAAAAQYRIDNIDGSYIDMIGPNINVYGPAVVSVDAGGLVQLGGGSSPVARIGDQVMVMGLLGVITQGASGVVA